MSHCHRYTTAAGLSRRALLTRMTGGLGAIALADLLSGQAQASLAGLPHYPAKAKRIIFLTMTGGMSHLESFDYKPELKRLQGEQIPPSVMAGKKPLGMSSRQSSFPLVGSSVDFAQHGQCGAHRLLRIEIGGDIGKGAHQATVVEFAGANLNHGTG